MYAHAGEQLPAGLHTILVRSDQEKALLAKQRQEELESQEAQEREAKQVQEDAI